MDTVMKTPPDRASLDAFVDGALAPEAAARMVLHLADCPADQAYVDAVMETNALLAAAYAGPMHAPLPERLRATIFPTPEAASAPPAPRPGWRAALRKPPRAVWGALAASLALAVGLGLGFGPGPDAPGVGPRLLAALERTPTGAVARFADGTEVELIASFLDAAGRPCREYEILDAAAGALTEGVACREPAGAWMREIAVASRPAAPERSGGSFVPAEGAGDEALGAALDRLGAGMAMTPAEEQALIAAGWAR